MKKQVCTAISTITIFLPWTLLYLRTFQWALESPTAEILIYSYGAFMILSGIFAVLVYTKGNVRSKWMQVCMVINGIYAIGVAAILLLTFSQ